MQKKKRPTLNYVRSSLLCMPLPNEQLIDFTSPESKNSITSELTPRIGISFVSVITIKLPFSNFITFGLSIINSIQSSDLQHNQPLKFLTSLSLSLIYYVTIRNLLYSKELYEPVFHF